MGQLKNKNIKYNNCENENKDKHEFAFFLENLSSIIKPIQINYNKKNTELRIEDKDLLHRITNIVRLEIGEEFIIFNQKQHALCSLISIEKKKSLTVEVISTNLNTNIEPKINLLVPILKRENFESVIYSSVELGANEIITLITEKSQKNFNQDRSIKILISAAEQSKNFTFSNISSPIELTKYLITNKKDNSDDNLQINVFFDAEGENLDDVVKNIKTIIQKNTLSKINLKVNLKINLMIGPEGDLTESEKILLKEHKFIFCKLTPTILRSFQAVNVGLGAFRALLV
ncbi:MAG: Ribosomal RNA small subunit methyltransferase E [candidate division TM6 bacterium GW2011_GWF2_30_66]|jgi:16S rRNA (uracil1498-N3)-methyltransferase|nr:MAG: Ribosomal RNA small subunit methyltransferase E [candidate division TM6 bacterium GW2011_GWF2_30_66]